MEFLSVLLIIVSALIILKLFAVFFHVGIFMLALPIKLLIILITSLALGLLLVPFGLLTSLAGLIILPITFLISLIPILLIGGGLWLLLRNN